MPLTNPLMGWESWTIIAFVFVIFIIGWLAKAMLGGRRGSKAFTIFVVFGLVVATFGAHAILAGMMAPPEPTVTTPGVFDFNIAPDNTAANWDDNIVSDVDLWDSSESDCNPVTGVCTVIMALTRGGSGDTGNTIAPDEALVDLNPTRIDNDPEIPDNEDYASLDITLTSAIPVLENTTTGDDRYLLGRDSDGRFYVYLDDEGNTAHWMKVGQTISAGIFQPSESQSTVRIGIKLNPAAFADNYGIGDSWQLTFDLNGNMTLTIIVSINSVS